MTNLPIVVQLEAEDQERVVKILTAAFYDYPVMRYVLEQERPDYDHKLTAMVGFFTEVRYLKGWPPFGVFHHGRMVATALVNPLTNPPGPPELRQAFKDLAAEIGSAAMDRLTAYEDTCEQMEPDAPHYYLGMIGVLPTHQGKGYARLLIEHLHNVVDKNPESAGICLNTEKANNVPLYRYLGYEVIGEAEVGPLHTWCMFRPSN